MRRRYSLALSLAALVLVLDQASKFIVERTVPLNQGIKVIPGFFNLVHTLNKGAAFGFLNRHDISWQTWFFIGASALAVALIFHLLKSLEREDTVLTAALGLILGGALGNLVDRVRTGLVVDFLEFYVDQFYWPAFNVADIAITVGSLAMIVAFYRRREKTGAPGRHDGRTGRIGE